MGESVLLAVALELAVPVREPVADTLAVVDDEAVPVREPGADLLAAELVRVGVPATVADDGTLGTQQPG